MKYPSIGTWITLNHFSIAEILADSGFDWLCIDLEHSVIDYYECEQLILAIQSRGLNAFVRVGENNQRIIKRVLDAGADGIIVPMINTKEDALKAVSYVKYPPQGCRGVGLARAQKYGRQFNEYRTIKAEQIILIAQIEHKDAIENLGEIISVNGIDGTFIGPYDLSGSLGKPGQYDDDDVREVIYKYERTVSKSNKIVGFHVIEPNYQLVLDKLKSGYNFIAFSLDIVFLGSIANEQVKKLRTLIL